MFNKIKAYVSYQTVRNDTVMKQVTYLNVQRFMLFSFIGAPVSLIHIIVFGFFNTSTPDEGAWRTQIILAHTMLMIVLILFGLFGYRVTRRQYKDELYKVLHIGFMLVIMTFGIVITGIDQLVSTNVTPFIMSSLVCGVALYTRPRDAILVYMLAVLAFVVMMMLTVTDMNVRVSNQVNGLTIGSLGMVLSMILWQRKVITLEQQVMINQQKSELEKTNKQLERLANYDLLTGLLNRFAFNQAIDEYLSKEEENGCLVFFDIDHFKNVNDTHGHPIGDALLKQFSQDLVDAFDSKGIICRWGGDEFLVFLPKVELEAVRKLATSFTQSIVNKTYQLNNEKVTITLSCGMTMKKPFEKELFSALYERSDKALYKAKESGRNSVKEVA